MEPRKEIITKEIFIQERKKFFYHSHVTHLVLFVVFSGLILCFSFMFRYPWIVFGILWTVFMFFLLFYSYIPSIKEWSKIRKGEFRVFKDTLIGSREGQGNNPTNLFFKPYALYFSTYGKYELPPRNYTWSKNFCATDQDVYNRACKGDTFYLFMIGKTILSVYNCKTFQFKE